MKFSMSLPDGAALEFEGIETVRRILETHWKMTPHHGLVALTIEVTKRIMLRAYVVPTLPPAERDAFLKALQDALAVTTRKTP